MCKDIKGTEAEILYHYTSAEGLLGILGSGIIRASDARFSNDWMEFEHGLKLLDMLLEDMKSSINMKIEKEILIKMQEVGNLLRNNLQSAYVFALTEKDDDLSQWRGYTPFEGGYAIGLSTKLLSNIVDECHLSAGPCIYNSDTKVEILRNTVNSLLQDGVKTLDILNAVSQDRSGLDEVASFFSDLDLKPWELEMFSKYIEEIVDHKELNLNNAAKILVTAKAIQKMVSFAVSFKHGSFSDEKEIRIIYIPVISIEPVIHAEGKYQIGFRERKGLIVPYVELPILSDNHHEVLKEIIIGPQIRENSGLSKRALSLFLETNGYHNCCIRSSRIPYRS